MYREAFKTILSAQGSEAETVKELLCVRIAYAYSLVGEVTDARMGIEGIDKVMSYGFHWAAPSVLVELMGGADAATQLLGSRGFDVPPALKAGLKSHFSIINSGKYFVAR
jgi:hypothetical protein